MSNRRRAAHRKTEADLLEELSEQVRFLRRSAAAYDNGDVAEAKRLATSICTLVHDEGRHNQSLLGQLGLLSKLKPYSTALKGRPGPVSGKGEWIPMAPPLVVAVARGSGPFKYEPHLKLVEWSRQLSFASWWSEEISRETRRPLTRKTLTYSMRSQDGGSHVGPVLSLTEYVQLKDDQHHPKVTMRDAAGNQFVPANAHLASVRQIAWELDEALQRLGIH